MEGCDAATIEAVEQGFDYRSVALRSRNGVRGDQFISSRRFARAHLSHARLWKNVDGNYQGHSRGRREQRGTRRSRVARFALRGNGRIRLRFFQRRRRLAAAATESATHLDA